MRDQEAFRAEAQPLAASSPMTRWRPRGFPVTWVMVAAPTLRMSHAVALAKRVVRGVSFQAGGQRRRAG